MEVLDFLHRIITNKRKNYLGFVVGIAFLVIFMLYTISVSHTNNLINIIGPKDGTKTSLSIVPVSGTVSLPSAKVSINGTPLIVAENGYFEGSADLINGINNITITAETETEKQVVTISVTSSQINY